MPIGGILMGALSLGKKVFGPKADGSLGLGQKLLAKLQERRLSKGKKLLLPSVHGQIAQQALSGATQTGVPTKDFSINATYQDPNNPQNTGGGFKQWYANNKTTAHVGGGLILALLAYFGWKKMSNKPAYGRR